MDPLQPGRSTSEFLITAVGTTISGIVALVTVLHPGFKMNPDTQRWIVSVLAGGMSLMVSLYTSSRTKVKTAAITSGSTAQQSQNLPTQQFNVDQVEPSDLAGGQVTMTGLVNQPTSKS